MKKSQSFDLSLPKLPRFFAPADRPFLRNLYSVFFSLALLQWGAAQAQTPSELSKVWFNAGFYSAHFDTDKGLRNPNPGFGIEYKLIDDLSLTAGGFTNSDNAHSNYLGAYYQPWRLGGVKLGVVGGLFNGYPKAFDGGWFPAVLPVASWESKNLGLNVMLVPPLKDRLYGAVSFQLKYRFSQ
jgi:hypothetical protein